MWQKIKSAARWVYDWATVLAGLFVGVPSALLDLLNAFAGVDITPLVGPQTAVKIVAGVAIVKAILAFIESRIRHVDDNP